MSSIRSIAYIPARPLPSNSARHLFSTSIAQAATAQTEPIVEQQNPNFALPSAPLETETETETEQLPAPAPEVQRLSPATRLARAIDENKPHFKLGHKQIWLPDLEVTFIQTPELHPRFAKFKVPLNIGKLDFRDFLWHGYQTRALNIRSWVYQRPVEIIERTARGSSRARWHRKKALKYMIVEMNEPFVWPKMPDSMKAFDPELFRQMKDKAVKRDGKAGKEKWDEGTDVRSKQREQLRKDAQSILSGKLKWRPTHEVYTRPRYN